MRILLIPDPTAPNGVDAFSAALVRGAPARGHEAAVAAPAAGPSAACDAVLVNSLQPAAIAAARGAGRKLVLRLIDSYAGEPSSALDEAKRLAAQADLLLVPSRYLEGLARSWGITVPIFVVPYAYEHIMAQQIALVTVRASRPRGFPLIAGGAFNEASRPGFETLISTVARLRLDCHLSLFGEGPALEALKARAGSMVASGKVHFLGAIPHARVLEYMRASKAYIDPVGLDGYPMIALHALSEGCPVIAARAGALSELIVDGQNGILFNPGDALGLSEAVVTLSSVPGLSLRLIQGGIKTVESHSWEATAEAALAALETLAPSAAGPAAP